MGQVTWRGLNGQNMRNRIRKIAAAAAIALGTAHLIYGVLIFKALTPEHIWFAGAGIAMICVGLSNWQTAARLQSVIMISYLIPMAILMPLPQVFLGLGLFITLALSGKNQRAYA